MTENKSEDFPLTDKFGNIYTDYSDNDLVSILKKRDMYQAEAATSAIREAIRRGIIHSDQDLFDEKFRPQPSRFLLFPVPEKKHVQEKLTNSIIRTMVISGLIPLIEGVLKYRSGYPEKSMPVLIFALSWIILSLLLMLKRKFTPVILLLLNTAALAYLLLRHFQKVHLMPMEWMIALFVIFLNFYLLLFYNKIIKSKNDD